MNFKLTLITFAGVLLFGTAKVNAQTTTFTPSHLKAAERLIIASGLERNIQRTFTTMIEMKSQSLPIDKREGFGRGMHRFIDKYITFEDLKKAFEPIYASEYTEEELNQIADFLSTPAGIKMTERQPELFKKSATWGQNLVLEHQADLEQIMKEEFAKK
jgi:hypothetical protein